MIMCKLVKIFENDTFRVCVRSSKRLHTPDAPYPFPTTHNTSSANGHTISLFGDSYRWRTPHAHAPPAPLCAAMVDLAVAVEADPPNLAVARGGGDDESVESDSSSGESAESGDGSGG
ncbi:hypothetical protein BDA96_10G068700 [Sorghum bicolor]|uniref:Uncharacterized protein n=1 Tax=Sorghum bicolor TaxID=4558 RepID=A0A921PZK4_SORBI|nr:hypothetical protein BDA96_10G068700 [Sorghum bicolor]